MSIYVWLQLVQTLLVHIGFVNLLEGAYFLLRSATLFKIVLTTLTKSTAVSISEFTYIIWFIVTQTYYNAQCATIYAQSNLKLIHGRIISWQGAV